MPSESPFALESALKRAVDHHDALGQRAAGTVTPSDLWGEFELILEVVNQLHARIVSLEQRCSR